MRTPVTSSAPFSCSSLTRSISCTTSWSMLWKPWRDFEPSSPMWKILPSASSRICATGRPCGLKAEVAISSLAATSFLSTERSRTISA